MKRVQDGVLVRLPVAEFDALVERATRSGVHKVRPRLLEARYHAVLQEEALIGDGQWKVLHKGPAPGLLNLEPFNLALRQARFPDGDALVAAFDGETPALLIETPGRRTVFLDWSARAEAGPEGLQFRLEVPPCPVCLVELDVPAGRAVTLLGANDDSLLLSGPHAADSASLRRWKIVCRGRDKIDFRIRPADRPNQNAAPSPAPFVVQKTTQKLHPDGLDATFELILDGLPRGVRELVCECDPELRLRDVLGPHVDSCSFQAGGTKPSRLTIRLREPVRAGTWQVVCLAPLTAAPAPAGSSHGIAWRSPGLRLVGGVPRGETLTLWLHPDLRVESWDPGSFRLRSIGKTDAERPNSMQQLTLIGGGLGAEGAAANAPPRRPEARLQAYGVEFRARQLAWWHCDAAGMALTAQIGWEVSQGQLFQLPVQLPPGWTVERVEMSPASLLRDSRVRTVGGRATLYVDLTAPLGPRTSGSRVPALTVHLRQRWAGPVARRTLPFPDLDLVPIGARFREGALALGCDEQLFHLDVRTTAERSDPEGEGPWRPSLPEYYYRYRGQFPTGTLIVRSRPPRWRAKCRSEVFVASGRAAVKTHLRLEAEVGSPETVKLSLSASDGEPWQWHNEAGPRGEDAAGGNHLRQAERLHAAEAADGLRVLSARNPLQAAVLFAARPPGERWRLTFARPLRARESIRLQATRHLQPRDSRWQVPLPVVLGPGRMEGEVTLHLTGGDLIQVQTVGLTEAASAAVNGVAPWRTFRYGQTEVALTLSGQGLSAGRAAVAAIDQARLIVYAGGGGSLQHHFSFHVANWGQHTLPLRLPPGSRPLAVQVDGHWLPRLVPATPDGAGNETEELALPVPGHGETLPAESVHRYEIVYTRPATVGVLWQTLDAPAPVLPVPPLAFRRVWRLAPNLTPLHDGRYQLVPGTHDDSGPPVLPRRAADLFHLSGVEPAMGSLLRDHQEGAREALARAVRNLCGRWSNRTATLSELVSDFAFNNLKDSYPLVIDATALRDAGITPDTKLTVQPLSAREPTPPWAECGLMAVPARSVILLTTASGRGTALREPLSDSLEQALAAAASRGQDPSGHFHSALSWLRPRSVSAAAPQPRLLGLDSSRSDWSEWEPVAGLAGDTLTVVRREVVTAAGFTLAVFLVLLFWILRRFSVPGRLTALLVVMALMGLSVLWLPSSLRDLAWFPLLAAGAGTLAWYLKAIFRAKSVPRSSLGKSRNPASGAATAGILLLAVLGWGGRAAPPTPVTIYMVPGSAEDPESQTVLVPADFLNRLKTLARPAPLVAGGPRAVLLDASYDGKLVGNQAEFAAVFSVYCPGEEPAMLTVPLDGVQLVGDVWLDGVHADPRTLPAPGAGYSLKVSGQGRHKLELRFRVPVAGTGDDRNVLFIAPPLVRSRLTWRTPAGALDTQVLVKQGVQWMAREGGGERLEVDVGRLPKADQGDLPRPIHLHWYQPAQPGRPPRVQYQGAYLWNLNLEASYLTAWLRYTVLEGAVKTLEIDLPADLEVRSASAQRTQPSSKTPPAWLAHFRLRDWYVLTAGGKRTLRLEFPYPIAGDFQVMLELTPHAPLPAAVTLALPSPPCERAAEHPAYPAHRTQLGLDARRDTPQNITRIPESEFAPGWSGVPKLDTPSSGAAYKISPGGRPVLRLHLHREPPIVQAKLNVGVQTGAQLAEVQIVADLKTPNKDLAVIEWDLQSPHVTIASLTGDDVRAWKQTGQRVLVWLNRTTTETSIKLSGWLPLERRKDRSHLKLFGPRLIQAREQHTRLRLTAAADLALASVQTEKLQAVLSPPTRKQDEREQIFETQQGNYSLDCDVQPASNAIARVLTLAEVADRRLRFTTTVDYEIRYGELRRVEVRLRNWEAEKVELQAEHEALRREPGRTPAGRSWQITLQPGVTGRYQLTLRGSMPVEDAAVGVPMPEVTVPGVELAEHKLAVAGGELAGEARGGLARLSNPSKALALWPGVAERVARTNGQVWRVRGPEWQLRLLPHARVLEVAPVHIFLLEQSAAVVDGRRWMHEARCWLRHEAHTDLNVDFAAPARVVAAAVDGIETTPLQPTSSRLWLPLSGRPGVRCVHLRWLYDEAEPLERPNLAPPRVVHAIEGPALWTVLIPAGWDTARSSAANRLSAGVVREGALALYRAEAQLRICQELCRQERDTATSAPLAAARRRFARYCRHAHYALEMDARAIGPEDRPLADWLGKLQDDNKLLAEQNGLDDLVENPKSEIRNPKEIPNQNPKIQNSRVKGFEIGDFDLGFLSDFGFRISDFGWSGTPISGWSAPGAKPPELQLTAHAKRQTRQVLAASGQWLGVFAVIWILSFVPYLLPRLRLFWPEQIALLGVIGWHLAGWTLVVLLLLLVAVGGRIFLLARAVRGLFRKRKNQPSTMTAGSGMLP